MTQRSCDEHLSGGFLGLRDKTGKASGKWVVGFGDCHSDIYTLAATVEERKLMQSEIQVFDSADTAVLEDRM